MLPEQLEQIWRDYRRSTPLDVETKLSDKGLVLGAGTLLAPSDGHSGPAADARLSVLTTVAYGGAPSPLALAHLRKSAQRCVEGDDAMASSTWR